MFRVLSQINARRNRFCAALAFLAVGLLSAAASAAKPAKLDQFGDPLPPDAIARLSTIRYRARVRCERGAGKFSENAKFLAIPGEGGGLDAMDVTTGSLVLHLSANHRYARDSVAFSGDERFMFTDGPDLKVHVWSLAKGTETKSIAVLTPEAQAWYEKSRASPMLSQLSALEPPPLTFIGASAKGHFIAVVQRNIGARTSRLELWRLGNPDKAVFCDPENSCGFQPTISPDERTLYIASPSGERVRAIAIESGAETRTLAKHSGRITAIDVSPDGRLLASVGADCTLRAWDTASGRELWHVDHPNGERCPAFVEFSPDGKKVWTRDDSGSSPFDQSWSAADGSANGGFDRRNPEFYGQIAISRGHGVVATNVGFTIALYSPQVGKPTKREPENTKYTGGLHSPPGQIFFTPDVLHIVTNGTGCADIWDSQSGKHICAPHASGLAALSRDGARIALAFDVETITFARSATCASEGGFSGRALESTPDISRQAARGLDFSPDGALLAAAGNQDLAMWDIAGRKEKWVAHFKGKLDLSLALGPGTAVVLFAPDSQTFALGPLAGGLKVVSCQDGAVLHSRENDEQINCLRFSKDGKSLYGTTDEANYRWSYPDIADSQTRIPIDPARRERLRIVSHSGKVTASYDPHGDISFRDFETDRALGSINYPYGADPVHMEFSPDDLLLATSNPDSTCLIWNTATFTHRK